MEVPMQIGGGVGLAEYENERRGVSPDNGSGLQPLFTPKGRVAKAVLARKKASTLQAINLCWQRIRIVFCECNYLLQCVRTNAQLGSQKTMPSPA